MDIKCAKRLQVAWDIEVLYVYEYLVQLHFNFCAPRTGRYPMRLAIPCCKLVLIGCCAITGLRSLEIDLFPDPTGGTYDQSVLLRLAGTDGWMNNSALQPAGFKVSCSLPCRSIRFAVMHAFGSTSSVGWNLCKISLECLQDVFVEATCWQKSANATICIMQACLHVMAP